jgi:hypothetical protein
VQTFCPSHRSQAEGEERMTIAWYDPTNHHVSCDKNDPMFTSLGQLWPLDVKRPWVGLTDEEIYVDAEKEEQAHGFILGAMWAETKLREKNGG